jgi:YD repeat-containing protein
MKNILGTTENLELFNKEGGKVYRFCKYPNGYSYERTCDSNGNVLTFKDSNGYSYEYTYDSNGNELTYKDSDGVSRGFDIPEYTMEELVERLGNFKIKK